MINNLLSPKKWKEPLITHIARVKRLVFIMALVSISNPQCQSSPIKKSKEM
jgi:hypothetical protein